MFLCTYILRSICVQGCMYEKAPTCCCSNCTKHPPAAVVTACARTCGCGVCEGAATHVAAVVTQAKLEGRRFIGWLRFLFLRFLFGARSAVLPYCAYLYSLPFSTKEEIGWLVVCRGNLVSRGAGGDSKCSRMMGKTMDDFGKLVTCLSGGGVAHQQHQRFYVGILRTNPTELPSLMWGGSRGSICCDFLVFFQRPAACLAALQLFTECIISLAPCSHFTHALLYLLFLVAMWEHLNSTKPARSQ